MWLIAEALLINYVLPDVLDLLVEAGVMSAFHAAGIKDAADLKLFLDNLKYTYTYPDDPPGITNQSNINRSDGG